MKLTLVNKDAYLELLFIAGGCWFCCRIFIPSHLFKSGPKIVLFYLNSWLKSTKSW